MAPEYAPQQYATDTTDGYAEMVTALDWNVLTRLAGATDRNFEHLTYDLVRRHYGRYGALIYPSNAVGVEFSLELKADCEVGRAGETVAWQCKWYHPDARLNGSRRADIRDSFKKSMQRNPPPSRWVLVTPHAFTEGEEEWLRNGVTTWLGELAADGVTVSTPVVDHWSEADFISHMHAPHDVVAAAWFGSVVLDPDWFRAHIARSTARLHGKFLADLHISTEIEKPIHDALGDDVARSWLLSEAAIAATVASDAGKSADEYRRLRASAPPDWSVLDDPVVAHLERLKEQATLLSELAQEAVAQLVAGRVDQALRLRPQVEGLKGDLSGPIYGSVTSVTDQSPSPQNADDLTEWAGHASSGAARVAAFADGFVQMLAALGYPLVAVVGRAGRGKSHLAARAASGFGTDAPVGVLLHGNDFKRRFSLEAIPDDLGLSSVSFETLVAALDAAGKASARRALLTIDGINESDEPVDWASRIPELATVASRYPNVAVLVTVRPTYEEIVWAAGPPPRLVADGFGPELREAMRRYLDHYKIVIRRGGAGVAPYFRDPMLLRVFCEATNPDHTSEVEVDLDEVGIDTLFDTLIDGIERRVAAARGEDQRAARVGSALNAIALQMWGERSRSIPLLAAKDACGDRPEAWADSRLRDVLSEDLLLARDAEGKSEIVLFPIDRFAGHCIAKAIIKRATDTGVTVGDSADVVEALCDDDRSKHHPLREDILSALAQLTARAGMHLFEASGTLCLQEAGVRALVDLPPAEVPPSAQTALTEWWDRAADHGERRGILDLLERPALQPDHPLNFRFTSTLLSRLSIVDRDLAWTEWLRTRSTHTRDEVGRLEELARAGSISTNEVGLVVLWAAWQLTTTDRDQRDAATRLLYWIGRTWPADLFRAALEATTTNDPYVRERLLAASYGVAMARAFTDDEVFREVLAGYCDGIVESMLAEGATEPTTHILSRDYARWTVDLAERVGVMPPGSAVHPPFRHGPDTWASIDPKSDEGTDAASSMRMDFENYTIGRLVEGRSNYDMSHAAYRAVLGAILWRVRDLGYRREVFGGLDREISDQSWRVDREHKIDRYGKKYAWIAFYEEAGRLEDDGTLPDRRRADGHGPDADLDPSFPEPIPSIGIQLGDWLGSPDTPDLDWLRLDTSTIPDDLLVAAELDGVGGPWVLVWGQIIQSSGSPGRQVFALTPGALIPEDAVDKVTEELASSAFPGRWALPEPRGQYYLYAGEIPWSPLFNAGDDEPPEPDAVAIGIAHEYAWESYHSTLNRASGAAVPSRDFAERFRLRGQPQTFDWFEPDGRRASISCRPDEPWEGQLLYVRGDLLRRYAESSSSAFAWIAWGERQILRDELPGDPAIVEAIHNNANLHRRVMRLDLDTMLPRESPSDSAEVTPPA
jgi:hypothetical protein